MPFAATWMGLETVILSEVGQRKEILYDAAYLKSLKGMIQNELIYNAETDGETWRTSFWSLG